MLAVKTNFDGDLRRFCLAPGQGNYVNLLASIQERYPVLTSVGFALSYQDDEGDNCSVAGDEELREAVNFAEKHHGGTLKLIVKRLTKDVKPAAIAQHAPVGMSVITPVTEKLAVAPADSFASSSFSSSPASSSVVSSPRGLRVPKWTLERRAPAPAPAPAITKPDKQPNEDKEKEKESAAGPVQLDKTAVLQALPELLKDQEVVNAIETVLGQGAVVHRNVICDQCGMNPIKGVRFSCTVCRDFDLCAGCEATGKHPVDHVFTKIKRSLPPSQAVVNCVHEKSGSHAVVAPAASVPASPQKPSGAQTAPLKAVFVSDETYPDGAVCATGSVIEKTWMLRNTGATSWPAGTQVLFIGGHLQPVQGQKAAVPVAAPTQAVAVTVSVQVPREPGRYTGYYRLGTADGKRFGQRVWVDLLAVAPSAPVETQAVAPPAVDEQEFKAGVEQEVQSYRDRYAAQLAKLLQMGFKDEEHLLELLVYFKGDESKVVDLLMTPIDS